MPCEGPNGEAQCLCGIGVIALTRLGVGGAMKNEDLVGIRQFVKRTDVLSVFALDEEESQI